MKNHITLIHILNEGKQLYFCLWDNIALMLFWKIDIQLFPINWVKWHVEILQLHPPTCMYFLQVYDALTLLSQSNPPLSAELLLPPLLIPTTSCSWARYLSRYLLSLYCLTMQCALCHDCCCATSFTSEREAALLVVLQVSYNSKTFALCLYILNTMIHWSNWRLNVKKMI